MTADLALVVLAAGASRRLGRCKALVELGGTTPLAHLCAAGRALGSPTPPLVVTGAHHDEIAVAAPPGVELCRNPAWDMGRTGGVALAAAAREGADLCIAPVDVPRVPAAVFAALAEAWDAAGRPPRGWLAPRHAGAFGHPIVLGRELVRELESLAADTPLRTLRERAEPLLTVDVEAPEVLDDLDGPDDLARILKRLG